MLLSRDRVSKKCLKSLPGLQFITADRMSCPPVQMAEQYLKTSSLLAPCTLLQAASHSGLSRYRYRASKNSLQTQAYRKFIK